MISANLAEGVINKSDTTIKSTFSGDFKIRMVSLILEC